ncbi:phge_HK97_gp10, phage protein, HK97 gp10 family [uncultured Caudovirales phage]|uniref:Phge_HK97_gp10, phage protein, HK97 gp10 family n=1 Tax=uncultured Caudovirales phage TaxID=2100421 RepID=A0A6J7WIV2_9CAUD|nr:phge_HK97_gp10, phage protein, HK97 gp10 family [uncultured Caudovirales phage]
MLKSYVPSIIKKLDDLSLFSEHLGKDLQDIIKAELDNGTGSGKVYQHDHHLHRASSAGQPPKTDTGALSKSVSSNKTGTGQSELRIKSNYAALLEYGSSTIRPRPFVAPAVKELKKKVDKKLKDDWK